ncbi:FUSC family protein [Pseudonocardia xinjiangensis]|uniref:FUSC family protein n=1 Tax=Pseudonocardia xinjiangensis TaxID=75289 RepID=UPI003D9022B6
MSWPAELRTRLTGTDPGLVRLRLAAIGTASMVLATAVMAVVSAVAKQPVTVLLFAAVLAMISSISVNEPDLRRSRVTTALMLVPAAAATTAGALLSRHHIPADVVFVVVMMLAVYVRRFGARGFALGMAGFNAYFFTQYLQATPAQLPWLLLAACVGVGSTLLLRGVLFVERPGRTLVHQLRAFDARVHDLVGAVTELVTGGTPELDARLRNVQRRQTRLNDTALAVSVTADRPGSELPGGGTGADVPGHVLDVELAAERLAVASVRMVMADKSLADDASRMLLDGLHGLLAATASGTPTAMVTALLDCAERSVAPIVGETKGHGDRVQRVAFAVTRLAWALRAPLVPEQPVAPAAATGPDLDTGDVTDDRTAAPAASSGLRLTTRQAIQVGVATSLAIVVGELVSPSRWYWAVITAFLVFAGTSSRGDVLTRGWGRILGTIGGVLAGVGLAALVSGSQLTALILLFVCIFLGIYLVQVSPALLAFWISVVLALLYGLIGQFSVALLVLRIEETAVGAALGIIAAYVVLPKRSREAFGEALDDLVNAVDDVLSTSVDRIVGRQPTTPSVELARNLHDALATLRARAAPLDSPLPWRRQRSSYHRTLQMLTGVEHYARSLVRLSDEIRAPDWMTVCPAAERVRGNLDGLRNALLRRDGGEIRSAEDVIDAAESAAAHHPEPPRSGLLTVSRVLRRTDQAVVALADDLRAGNRAPAPDPTSAPEPTGSTR